MSQVPVWLIVGRQYALQVIAAVASPPKTHDLGQNLVNGLYLLAGPVAT